MLTLFSTPKPFKGHNNIIQRNALQSWTLLHPDVEVILFGNEEGAAEVCQELGIRHEAHLDRNEYGTPLINSLLDRAQEIARHPILCYVNCDILLLNDFCEAVSKVASWRDQFLMIGRRWDTNVTELIDFSQSDWRERLRLLALRTNRCRPAGWIDYFIFSRGVYYRKVPPFAIGRTCWDQWLVWFGRSSRIPVVDVSRSVLAVHQDHDYSHHPLGYVGAWGGEEAKTNETLMGSKLHNLTIENAQYRLGELGLKRSRRHLIADFKVFGIWAWYTILDATRPIRHKLGLRSLRKAENRSNP